MEQARVIENKLFNAEQNRLREIEKRLENLRMHVGFFTLSHIKLIVHNTMSHHHF